MEELIVQIQDAASAATLTRSQGFTVQLGEGKLRIGAIQPVQSNYLAVFDHPAPFDVIASTTIEIRQPSNRYRSLLDITSGKDNHCPEKKTLELAGQRGSKVLQRVIYCWRTLGERWFLTP